MKGDNQTLNLDKWLFNNFLVLNPDKCNFMTLGTTNIFPNFKYNNLTIKISVSEKLSCVIIDNKLDFTKHVNTIGKKANLNLHALNRI